MFSHCAFETSIYIPYEASTTMSEDQQVQTLNYLQDAGYLLQRTAPEISAHLLNHRSNLARKTASSATDIQRQHVCVACGQIFVLGVNSSMNLRPRESKRGTKSNDPDVTPRHDGPSKGLSCGSCRQTTVIKIPGPGPVPRRQRKAKSAIETKPEVGASNYASNPKSNLNASSKKRAKNRKAGLQALLSSQPKQNKSLSLSDFMR